MTIVKMKEVVEKIKTLEGFEKVKFIIFYGSAAEGRMDKDSDIDICIYHEGELEEMSHYRFKVLS